MKDNSGGLGLGDIIKKIVSIGIGSAFLTEEALRNILKETPLSKDIIAGLLQNAKNAKAEFGESLRDEFQKYLSRLEVENMINRIIENYDIQVKAEFSFKKKRNTSRKKGHSNVNES